MNLPTLVPLPGDSFVMGSPGTQPGEETNETPQRAVRIAPFRMGRTPVTFAEWDHFATETGGYRPSDEGWGRGARPVINVSWIDAQAYLAWAGTRLPVPLRLPSEAEWEYAARAGTTTAFHWGDAADPDRAHFFHENGAGGSAGTVPVGQFPANAFGLHDMLGNVWEWTADCWNEFYLGAHGDARPWLGGDCERRVLRGGSFLDVPRQIRCASRNRNAAAFRCNDYGFRVAADA